MIFTFSILTNLYGKYFDEKLNLVNYKVHSVRVHRSITPHLCHNLRQIWVTYKIRIANLKRLGLHRLVEIIIPLLFMEKKYIFMVVMMEILGLMIFMFWTRLAWSGVSLRSVDKSHRPELVIQCQGLAASYICSVDMTERNVSMILTF